MNLVIIVFHSKLITMMNGHTIMDDNYQFTATNDNIIKYNIVL